MTELEFSRIYSYSELSDLGYSSNLLTEMIRKNKLTRLQRGFYTLPQKNDDLYMVVQLFPEAILCLESALYYYGYIKKKPDVYPIAVHKSHNRYKFSHSDLPIRAYFRDDKYIDLGVTNGLYSGVSCQVYDRERTICDCIRKKDLLSQKDYKQAIHSYFADDLKNVERLKSYAKELRIEKKVDFLIDTML